MEGEAGLHWQRIADQHDEAGGEDCADGQPRDDGCARDGGDLHQIDAHDVAARCPEDFQCGNGAALGAEIGGDAVGDADAGDDQRGEADQREELAHTLDEAVGRWRGAISALHLYAAVLVGAGQGFGAVGQIGGTGDADAIFAGVEAAGLEQAGAADAIDAGQRDGAEGEALANPVRLGADDPGDAEAGGAEAQGIANA